MLVLDYSIGFLFSCGLFALGRAMRLHPQTAERFFFWMPRFAAAYFRIFGLGAMFFGIFGICFYPILIVIHLI